MCLCGKCCIHVSAARVIQGERGQERFTCRKLVVVYICITDGKCMMAAHFSPLATVDVALVSHILLQQQICTAAHLKQWHVYIHLWLCPAISLRYAVV